MYLYHYPDIWYDYATWHAKSGSIDAAIKVFQRSLKALPGMWSFFPLILVYFQITFSVASSFHLLNENLAINSFL